MATIKLAFFDIDGTLIGSDGGYSQATKSAVLELRRNGVRTAIASGRPPFAAQFLFDELDITDVGLFYAGAAIYDPLRQCYLKSHYLNDIQGLNDTNNKPDNNVVTLLKLLATIKKENLYCEAYTRNGFATEQKSDIYYAHSRVLRIDASLIQSIESVVESNAVYKLLIGAPINAFKLSDIELDFPEFDFAYAKMASHSDWLFASVTNKSSCRKNGFDYLCDFHHVTPEEVIAFGDAQSDKVFIESAGLGVAMGDAPNEVKQLADIVTDTADNDGVAKVINRLLA